MAAVGQENLVHAVLIRLECDARNRLGLKLQRPVAREHVDRPRRQVDAHPIARSQHHHRLIERPFLRLAAALAIAGARHLRKRHLRGLSAGQLHLDGLLVQPAAEHFAVAADDELARPELSDVEKANDFVGGR